MTVIVQIGRRVPKSWFKRGAARVKGLMTFQENIWQMIVQSLKMAKKKADSDGRMTFVLTKQMEPENLHYMFEWVKIVIQGTPEMELEEYNDSMKLYDKLGKSFKKDFDIDTRLSKHFKSKIVNAAQIEDAYKKGYGCVEKNNIAKKLLEMGIVTLIEKIDDFDSREKTFFG